MRAPGRLSSAEKALLTNDGEEVKAFAVAILSVALSVSWAGGNLAHAADEGAQAEADRVETSPHWDTAPRMKRARGLPPLFPLSYVRSDRPGWAVVTYTVGLDGKSKDVVLESSSDPTFGGHVAAAIRVWPHVPARKSGVPVEATVTRRFALEFD